MFDINAVTINILGVDWKVEFVYLEDDEYMQENNLAGYTDNSSKLIRICVANQQGYKNIKRWGSNPEENIKSTLRHEIFHAFLYESGLDNCTKKTGPWACNEEMVDWFAIQSPKIFEVFNYLNIAS